MLIIPSTSHATPPLDPTLPSTPIIRLVDGKWRYTGTSRLTRADVGLTPLSATSTPRERFLGGQYVTAQLAGETLAQGFLVLICQATLFLAQQHQARVTQHVDTATALTIAAATATATAVELADLPSHVRHEIYTAVGGPLDATIYNYTTKGQRERERQVALWRR